uniref:Uncharacterized protein n=1 Tax=Triticum urartu TaxID=4572 RepID=A0A8R7TLE3_TRIUA
MSDASQNNLCNYTAHTIDSVQRLVLGISTIIRAGAWFNSRCNETKHGPTDTKTHASSSWAELKGIICTGLELRHYRPWENSETPYLKLLALIQVQQSGSHFWPVKFLSTDVYAHEAWYYCIPDTCIRRTLMEIVGSCSARMCIPAILEDASGHHCEVPICAIIQADGDQCKCEWKLQCSLSKWPDEVGRGQNGDYCIPLDCYAWGLLHPNCYQEVTQGGRGDGAHAGHVCCIYYTYYGDQDPCGHNNYLDTSRRQAFVGHHYYLYGVEVYINYSYHCDFDHAKQHRVQW